MIPWEWEWEWKTPVWGETVRDRDRFGETETETEWPRERRTDLERPRLRQRRRDRDRDGVTKTETEWPRERERSEGGSGGVRQKGQAAAWGREGLCGRGVREKNWPKWCNFGISGTGPKPVQTLRFAVFMVEPAVSGFWPIFLFFRFFQRTGPDWAPVLGWTGRSGPVFKTMVLVRDRKSYLGNLSL